MYQIEAMCLLCNDKRHYQSKVNDTERIIRYLQRYGSDCSIEDYDLWHRLNTDHQHIHFMCGTCIKVNAQELKRSEEQLCKVVYSIITDIRNGRELPVFEILRTLQGYYPIMYRCVEKEYKEGK